MTSIKDQTVTLGPGKFEFSAPVKFGLLPDTDLTSIARKPPAEPEEVSEDDMEDTILAEEEYRFIDEEDEEEPILPPPNA